MSIPPPPDPPFSPDDLALIEEQLRAFEPDVQNELSVLLVERRNGQDQLTRVRRLVLPDRPTPLLIAPSEILVRLEDAGAARNLLGKEWDGPHEVMWAPGRSLGVVRFIGDVADAAMTAAVDGLWDQGIVANFTHITPSGPYVKNGAGTARTPTGTPPTWNGATGDTAGLGVQVAVIDTGIAFDDTSWDTSWLHDIGAGPTERDPLRHGNSPDVLDEGAGHGTFVTGVIRQIAPDVNVRCYRALDSEGIGTEVQVACAIVQAAADGADIINLSLGSETYRDRPPVALEAALALIPDHVVVVAAAGNQGSSHPFWPAAFKRVIGVGALTTKNTPAQWSNRGSWVDAAIRGEGVVSTFVVGTVFDEFTQRKGDTFTPTEPWAIWCGTSFAAPQITGLIAKGALGRTPREAAAELLRTGMRIADFGVALASPLRYPG